MRHLVYFYANEDGSVKCVSLEWLEGEVMLGHAHVQINDEQIKRNFNCEKRNAVWSDEIDRCKSPPK